MCDMPSAFRSVTRQAAKQHKCCECGKTIEKGEQYQYSSGVWDSRPDSFKQCLNCHEIMMTATSYAVSGDECPPFGMLREWFGEFQCAGFKGETWLNGMAEQIHIEPAKLNQVLRVQAGRGNNQSGGA